MKSLDDMPLYSLYDDCVILSIHKTFHNPAMKYNEKTTKDLNAINLKAWYLRSLLCRQRILNIQDLCCSGRISEILWVVSIYWRRSSPVNYVKPLARCDQCCNTQIRRRSRTEYNTQYTIHKTWQSRSSTGLIHYTRHDRQTSYKTSYNTRDMTGRQASNWHPFLWRCRVFQTKT